MSRCSRCCCPEALQDWLPEGHLAYFISDTVVDVTAHIIVAAELTNNASDAGELPTMLHAVKNNLGQTPEQALADTGYRSEAVFEQLADSGTDLVVALGREGKQRWASTPRAVHTWLRWRPSCKALKARLPTGDESGSLSHPTAG